MHYILPSLTLGAAVAAVMGALHTGIVRGSGAGRLWRTVRAKGLNERVVVLKHCLRNALIPVVTMMGFAVWLSCWGSIVVEAVFNWPAWVACWWTP